jgi:hypothetical protein
MNATNTNANGQVQRKTLASQLDRLDSIIDALANGLNETVADVLRQTVAVVVPQVVQGIIQQVLTHPDVLRLLAAQQVVAATPATAVVEPVETHQSKLGRMCRWVGRKSSNCWSGICSKIRKLPEGIRFLGRKIGQGLQKVWEYRRPVFISLAVGLAAGGIGYWGGEVIASLALGLCSSTMTFFGIVAAPFIRLWKSLQTQTA